jgi:hypothetical protein
MALHNGLPGFAAQRRPTPEAAIQGVTPHRDKVGGEVLHLKTPGHGPLPHPGFQGEAAVLYPKGRGGNFQAREEAHPHWGDVLDNRLGKLATHLGQGDFQGPGA